MPLNVPAGFGLLSYLFTVSGDPEPMATTIGVDVAFGAAGPQEKVDQKADAFMNATTASQLSGGYTFIGCELRTGGAGVGGAVWEALRSLVGSGNPSALPNNCAYLYKKLTAISGRRGRGRMYIPPYIGAEGNVNSVGVIDEATRVAIEDYLALAMPGDDYVLLHDTVPSTMAPTPIIGFSLDRRIATQRRRLR
jgi:hypothetical protein